MGGNTFNAEFFRKKLFSFAIEWGEITSPHREEKSRAKGSLPRLKKYSLTFTPVRIDSKYFILILFGVGETAESVKAKSVNCDGLGSGEAAEVGGLAVGEADVFPVVVEDGAA